MKNKANKAERGIESAGKRTVAEVILMLNMMNRKGII